jgi:hypothetical protein
MVLTYDAYAEREILTEASVNQFSEELFKMKQEIEKLKGQKRT